MKRIVVIGSGGAGKSTFSRRLGEATGIEVIHLDTVFWRPGWEQMPKDEWASKVSDMVGRDSWIMDGNFGGTREIRVRACDTVIMLDIPRRVCLYRVIKRAIMFRGRSRPDMAAGCNEKFDFEFLSWVWNYPLQGRKRVFEEMKAFPNKNFVVLKSTREAEDFLRKSTSNGFSR